jgi:acetylglutamate kinase
VSAVRVYKLGGPALEDPVLPSCLAAELRATGDRCLLVHGGGRQVEGMLRRLGIDSHFVGGRRATSRSAMEVVEMVLSGLVNKSLVASLAEAGLAAVGLSARDGLVRAELLPGLGCVGRPAAVETRAVFALWAAGLVPVVSPVSAGPSGEAVNVNADEAALALACALGARSLVSLSDVEGVLCDGEPLPVLDGLAARDLLERGIVTGGMALKVEAALEAVQAGIPEVVVAGKARLLGGFEGTRVVGSGVPREAAAR